MKTVNYSSKNVRSIRFGSCRRCELLVISTRVVNTQALISLSNFRLIAIAGHKVIRMTSLHAAS